MTVKRSEKIALGALVGAAVVWVSLTALTAVEANDESAQIAAPPGEVKLKALSPARVAYLEHRGPYWALGDLFRRVAEFMAANDQPGPMFARYLDDPAKVPVGELRAEVGFLVTGTLDAPAPYRTRVLPQRNVASLIVEGRLGRAPASYARVRAWIEENGYQEGPGITELFPVAGRRQGSGPSITEIQITLLGRDQALPADAAAPPPSGSVQERLDNRRLAERIIPSGADYPDEARRWLSQYLLRLDAVRTTAGIVYPARQAEFEAVASPILARSRLLPAAEEPRATAATSPRWTGSPRASNSLSRLDALLVNVTLKRLEAGDALGELVELTQAVPDLINSWSRPDPEG